MTDKTETQDKNIPAKKVDADSRFLLANERTLLAWIRTALAFVAGGLALIHIGSGSEDQVFFGLSAVGLGMILAMIGYIRFQAADKNIRLHKLPAPGIGPIILVFVVLAFSVAVILTEVLN